ncbi:unnamed protein product [Toxocara canis]|nr:unnamed protein product [Toxocara canis]
MHRDILVLNFIDSYYNLTNKAISTLRWASEYCTKPTVIYQGDPDVAVFPDAIKRFFGNIRRGQPYIFGKCLLDEAVHRDPSDKWYVSKELYAPSTYPTFMPGGANIFSSAAPQKLLEAMEPLEPYFHLEDVFVSGILAERAKIPRICLETIAFTWELGNLHKCWQDPLLAILEVGSPELVQKAFNDVDRGMAGCRH